jgi:hypothetical protein
LFLCWVLWHRSNRILASRSSHSGGAGRAAPGISMRVNRE